MSEENKDPINMDDSDRGESKDTVLEKTERMISLRTFLITTVALLVATVMLTYTICHSFYKVKLAEAQLHNIDVSQSQTSDALALIDALFRNYSYYGVEDEKIIDTVLNAYVEATGDIHAKYYNAQEYEELKRNSLGEYCGIGITVVNSTAEFEGIRVGVLDICLVSEGGPAYNAGVKVGDLIYTVEVDGSNVLVSDLGYIQAVSAFRGAEGSVVNFTILRPDEKGGYTKISCSAERKDVANVSAVAKVSESDPSVGIVSLYRFDLNTPTQFRKAMDTLISKGCDSFVFDLRNNPGGDLRSIVAILSFLVEKNDVIISIQSKNGEKEDISARAVSYDGEYLDCSVNEKDIGKYRDKISKMTVLCNSSTASAAELFCSVIRDYQLGTLVGETTYGKGSVQTTISLEKYGHEGALRLTTAHYFPPSGVGYHGEGIKPHLAVELSDAAKEYNLYKLPQSVDNQLKAAVDALK